MTDCARIEDGIVVEIIPPHPSGAPLAECFPPSIVATCVPIPDGATVQEGYLWTDGVFSPPAPPEVPEGPRYVPVATLRERLEAAGKWEATIALLTPAQILKLATLRDGVDAEDPEVHDVLDAAGADPVAMLAP